MTFSNNPQIRALLDGFREGGATIADPKPVSIDRPGDALLMKLMRGDKLAAIVIVQDLKVVGYRLFIEADGFTVPDDVETVLKARS